MKRGKPPVVDNPWAVLRRFTAARIALGRSGVSQPTAAQLAFQLDHALARDAVHRHFDAPAFAQQLAARLGQTSVAESKREQEPVPEPESESERGPASASASASASKRVSNSGMEVGQPSPRKQQPDAASGAVRWLALASAASTREIYLQRPDLGRRLDDDSAQALRALQTTAARAGVKAGRSISLVIADGLSALAIEQQAEPFLAALLPRLGAAGWHCLPIAVVAQARVAIGDEIGASLGADVVVVMIGERPGLSSPDSMGLYLTWAPRPGLTDERRNCISNVRPAGLPPQAAALQLEYLLTQAGLLGMSGVTLKVELPIERL